VAKKDACFFVGDRIKYSLILQRGAERTTMWDRLEAGDFRLEDEISCGLRPEASSPTFGFATHLAYPIRKTRIVSQYPRIAKTLIDNNLRGSAPAKNRIVLQ